MPTTSTSATPFVTVIIPTYNEIKYLPPCLESLNHQTFTDFKVICIDKSTDGTIELCQKNGWQVIAQQKSGISAARAEGFARAKSEIIASTNADTAVNPDWLEKIVENFKDPQVVCSYGPVYFLEGRTSLYYRLLGNFGVMLFRLSHFLKKDHVIGENFAVRKSAYEAIGGFNQNLPTAEDVDLGYRIQTVGKVIFDLHQIAYTSNRRAAKQKLGFFLHHAKNFLNLTLLGKSSSSFEPIR